MRVVLPFSAEQIFEEIIDFFSNKIMRYLSVEEMHAGEIEWPSYFQDNNVKSIFIYFSQYTSDIIFLEKKETADHLTFLVEIPVNLLLKYQEPLVIRLVHDDAEKVNEFFDLKDEQKVAGAESESAVEKQMREDKEKQLEQVAINRAKLFADFQNNLKQQKLQLLSDIFQFLEIKNPEEVVQSVGSLLDLSNLLSEKLSLANFSAIKLRQKLQFIIEQDKFELFRGLSGLFENNVLDQILKTEIEGQTLFGVVFYLGKIKFVELMLSFKNSNCRLKNFQQLAETKNLKFFVYWLNYGYNKILRKTNSVRFLKKDALGKTLVQAIIESYVLTEEEKITRLQILFDEFSILLNFGPNLSFCFQGDKLVYKKIALYLLEKGVTPWILDDNGRITLDYKQRSLLEDLSQKVLPEPIITDLVKMLVKVYLLYSRSFFGSVDFFVVKDQNLYLNSRFTGLPSFSTKERKAQDILNIKADLTYELETEDFLTIGLPEKEAIKAVVLKGSIKINRPLHLHTTVIMLGNVEVPELVTHEAFYCSGEVKAKKVVCKKVAYINKVYPQGVVEVESYGALLDGKYVPGKIFEE